MEMIDKVNAVFGRNRSDIWCDGFFAGYRGLGCPQGSHPEFEDGYGRGYEASEIESENKKWWKANGRNS